MKPQIKVKSEPGFLDAEFRTTNRVTLTLILFVLVAITLYLIEGSP